MKYEYIHKACGEVTWITDKPFNQGDIIKSSDITLPDGTHPPPHAELICYSCKEKLAPFSENFTIKIILDT